MDVEGCIDITAGKTSVYKNWLIDVKKCTNFSIFKNVKKIKETYMRLIVLK